MPGLSIVTEMLLPIVTTRVKKRRLCSSHIITTSLRIRFEKIAGTQASARFSEASDPACACGVMC